MKESEKQVSVNRVPLDDGFAVVLQKMEREAFDNWYATNSFDFTVNPFGSRVYCMQWNAWKARASLMTPCRGIAHRGCDYLAPCGSICNKCGQAV